MLKNLINSTTRQGGGVQSNNNNGFSQFVGPFERIFDFTLNFNKILAFTLAETLIVIGIIGVVASLTIPNLNSTTADKEKVAKVKKVYAQITEAFERAQAVYGPYDEWFTDGMTDEERSTRIGERMLEFMKVSKVCKQDGGCFSTSAYYDVAGNEIDDNRDEAISSNGGYSAILADGTSIAFWCGTIYIDIDGPNKGQTREGIDEFGLGICTLLQTDDGSSQNITPQICPFKGVDYSSTSTGDFDNNYSPLSWVLTNGNMDYLKDKSNAGGCPDGEALNWETKTSCK